MPTAAQGQDAEDDRSRLHAAVGRFRVERLRIRIVIIIVIVHKESSYFLQDR